MDFVELIVSVHEHLDRGGIAHAFGGALALGYVAEPRGTVDIDVNVFVPTARLDEVTSALEPAGFRPPDEVAAGPPVAGVRFTHTSEPFPLDVFPSLDERYTDIERRVVRHPFGRRDDVLPFLSAEDLCVFKLSFNRAKDWLDLAAIATARPDLDLDVVTELLVALRGPTMHPRLARFRALV
ncbi:MAG: nucleotidyl transferase AbiEii/AbiGii toxin family protein [Acidimicrobiales bacterium]|nr:nucleotidyl transferase AbiEii/AbiGii toxin family protein [Acidimicrobiales bacterium]MCB1016011.1 nucleotidyl transferase AbiEii/AbiGii toxin family protein [Acidimicrobiales bacterium]MCB9373422.1 nucleotidyl transferase AbiEii/AbiGii toxin family protein [Microthrixaceae bacterium]